MQTSDLKLIFCASLLRLRKARGRTQAEVAAALRISDKTYSKWERGENNPSLTDIAAQLSGLSDSRCEELLLCAAGEGICSRSETHLGEETVPLYRFEADQMLCGILTLAHLSLPDAEKNGCWYFNTPAHQIMVEGSVS